MVLFRRRRVFVCVAGFVLVGAVLYASFGKKYEAKMEVLVRRDRAEAPLSAGENAPLDLTRMTIAEEDLNSEVELLRGADILRRVVEDTGIGGRDWFHFIRLGEGPAERVERAARRLGKNLKVEPLKKTNLIAIRYAANAPRVAEKVLRSVGNAYLAKHMAVHRPEGEFSFFEQQVTESRGQLDEAKSRLLNFSTLHGVAEAGLQRDLTLQKLSELDAGDRQTHIELSETERRVSELQSLVATLPERTTTQVRTADNPELLKALKSSLLELELKRTQLLTKFEPSHRLVREVDQQIAQAQSAIAAERQSQVRDETTDRNTHFEWAKAELQKAQVQLKALAARETATSAQEGSYRRLAKEFAEDAVTQDELLRNEKAALENYLLYVKKQHEARMNDALDRRGIVNVAIAEQPVAPALPVWPASLILAWGIATAAAAGTGAAFAADYLDPAFRDPDDVMACLNAPVLASLPRAHGRLSA